MTERWILDLSDTAIKQMNKIDKKTRARIMLFLEERVIVSKRPKSLAKPLKGHLSPFWRFRVGDYRIIADILDDRLIIQVVEVGHRREIYH